MTANKWYPIEARGVYVSPVEDKKLHGHSKTFKKLWQVVIFLLPTWEYNTENSLLLRSPITSSSLGSLNFRQNRTRCVCSEQNDHTRLWK